MRPLRKVLRPPQLGGDSLRASDRTAMNTKVIQVEAEEVEAALKICNVCQPPTKTYTRELIRLMRV